MKNQPNLPLIIQKLEALLRRLPVNHPKRPIVEDQLGRYQSGIIGERSLQYFYRYLPKEKVDFLHGIRIFHLNYYFQIDTIILTPRFLLLLEIKNYSGHIYFDDKFGQLIRRQKDKTDVFEDPLYQVKRQSFHLSNILKDYEFQSIPIRHLVVFSHPKAYIECSPTYKEAFHSVIKSSRLEDKFKEFHSKHKKTRFTAQKIDEAVQLLNTLNEPFNPFVCEMFDIKTHELLTGVFCTRCKNSKPMIKAAVYWGCTSCGYRNENAHIQALKDYALLLNTHINNRKAKAFLHLMTNDQSYYLLKSLNLPTTGSTRSKTYHLDSLLK